jgi:subfamily B ATP-binding cassette protein MsbA
LVVVGGGATNLLFQFLQKKTKRLSHKITLDSHVFQGLLIQKVAFFKYLKSTGLIHKYADKLIKTNDELHQAQKKSGLYGAILAGIREPVVILVVVLAIMVQVYYFHQGIALIIFTLLLFYRALISLTGMQNYANLFVAASGSLQNMTEFNDDLKDGKEETGTESFDHFNQEIVLQNVGFAYNEHQILQDIDLRLKKNETIAIVGESGSGKTTLINLLTGLLKPTSGDLLIDGVNIDTYRVDSIQNRIGYITQEAVVFNDSIFNNVTFWDQPTQENMARFEAALKKASIYDFVMKQPLKQDALLGNNGINVSGGQKQRISIARELYKEVDFLFMDEATSALDSETESEIQENIEKLKGKYTIVIIAHRLSTIKNADRIILLNKGKINAVGTFDQLLQTSPLFAKMVQLQGF